eukprot:m.27091 g.27091  ORF g.27091 m.27091 type:complete len:180 (+) comp9320_c0_seq2:69-608(+)
MSSLHDGDFDMLLPSYVALPFSFKSVQTLKYSKDAIYEKRVSGEELMQGVIGSADKVMDEAVTELVSDLVKGMKREMDSVEEAVNSIADDILSNIAIDCLQEVVEEEQIEQAANDMIDSVGKEILSVECEKVKYGCINNNGVKIVLVKQTSKFRKKPRHPTMGTASQNTSSYSIPHISQ